MQAWWLLAADLITASKFNVNWFVMRMLISTCIKDVGITIRHSRGYVISILQGPERGWRERTPGQDKVYTHKIKENQPIMFRNLRKLHVAFKNPKNPGLHFSDVRKNHGFLREAACTSKVIHFYSIFDPNSPYNVSPAPKMQVWAPSGAIYYIWLFLGRTSMWALPRIWGHHNILDQTARSGLKTVRDVLPLPKNKM